MHRRRHQGHADAGRDQADDRQHLGRVLNDARVGAERDHARDQQVVEAGRLVAGKQHERLGREPLAAAPGAATRAYGRWAARRPCAPAAPRTESSSGSSSIGGRTRPTSTTPALTSAQLLGGRALVQLDLDVGRRGAEPLHDPGHDREQRRADEVDAQAAGLTGVDPARGGDGAVELAQQLARRRAGTPAPAGVSSTRRRVRVSSWQPSSSSSARICWLSGGWEMCSRAAARRK